MRIVESICPRLFAGRELLAAALLALACFVPPARAEVDMAEVRRLAGQPVERILDATGVERVPLSAYPGLLADTRYPLIAFFYANADGESQRVATLIRYLAPQYRDRIRFVAVRVAQRGKPAAAKLRDLTRRYGVKRVPGVLYYDNPGQRLALEVEEYIDADFKEFRSPRMLLWSTYYRVVQRELDKLLAD